MRAYGFTETGTRHARRGCENQDASFVEARGSYAFAFMADGMGSADLAGEAARLSVEMARDMTGLVFMPYEEADDQTGQMVVRASFAAAFNALQRSANFDEAELSRLLNTFMAVYFNERTGILHYGYCGDGGIVVLTRDGQLRLAEVPHKGETDFQTTCLLDFDDWCFGTIENASAFLMMTDGLFDALCPRGAVGVDSVRAEATDKLLRAPLSLDDARMRPYLDATFSAEGAPLDELGALFGDVSDDRSVVVVAGASDSVLASGSASGLASAPGSALASASGSALASAPVSTPAHSASALTNAEIEQVRMLLAACGSCGRVRRFARRCGREARHERV